MDRTLIGVLTMVLLCPLYFIMHWKNEYCHASAAHMNGKTILPDIMHNMVGHHAAYSMIANLLTAGVILCFIVTMIALQRWDDLLIYALLFVVSIYIKTLYAIATILPDSNHGKCHYSKSLFETITKMGSCNDLNLSGHCIAVLIALYMLSKLTGHRYWFAYLVLALAAFFFICASRNHYTIDCINSVAISFILIVVYEWLVRARR